MSKVKIYKLIDPNSNEVRYVGKTITPLYDRLKVHIMQSKRSQKPTYKEAWIKSLLKNDQRPIMELIEEVENDLWVEREVYWISYFKNLTNLSKGGESGNLGCTHSDELKAKLRDSVKSIKGFYKSGLGRKWTEEQKEKRRMKPAWNKGIVGVFKASEETKRKMSETHKNRNKNK